MECDGVGLAYRAPTPADDGFNKTWLNQICACLSLVDARTPRLDGIACIPHPEDAVLAHRRLILSQGSTGDMAPHALHDWHGIAVRRTIDCDGTVNAIFSTFLEREPTPLGIGLEEPPSALIRPKIHYPGAGAPEEEDSLVKEA